MYGVWRVMSPQHDSTACEAMLHVVKHSFFTHHLQNTLFKLPCTTLIVIAFVSLLVNYQSYNIVVKIDCKILETQKPYSNEKDS